MSKTQEAPPDSWDMDTNDNNQTKKGDPADGSLASGMSAISLNVNAPAFVPNVNAPAFVPSMVSVPPPAGQMSAAPGGFGAPVVSVNTATSIQNGK